MRRPGDDWPKILGLLVFAVALWAQPAALVGAFYDDGVYTVLAKALAEGEGYRYIHLPGSPPAVHYPILYPAALSVLWRLWPAFPANVALFQVFDSAALGVAAWLIGRQLRALETPAIVQYLFVPAGFLAFPLLTIVGVRFSEPLFLALSAGAVSLADREKRDTRHAVIAGLLAGLAALARTVGLSVIAGVVIGLWLRRERGRAVLALAVAVLVVAPWFVWVAVHAHEVDPRIASTYGTYMTEARQAGVGALLAGLNLRALAPPGRLALGFEAPWLRLPLLVLLFGALVWGAVVVARRGRALVSWLILYVALVTLWHYASDRFMWIVLPWLAALVGCGLVAAWYSGRVLRILVAVLGLALCAGYLPREILSLRSRSFAATAEGISQPSRILVPSIDAGLPADAVIAAEGEPLIFLYTGRRAVPNSPFKYEGSKITPFPPEEVRRFFCDSGVTHIALSGPDSDGAAVVAHLAAMKDSPIQPLFNVTRGPAIYRFQCSG